MLTTVTRGLFGGVKTRLSNLRTFGGGSNSAAVLLQWYWCIAQTGWNDEDKGLLHHTTSTPRWLKQLMACCKG